jgi:iron-sulfur cluster repair protein YtfE (RIC family)
VSLAQTIEIHDPLHDLPAGPLEWFFADHARHRQVCRLMTEAAQDLVFDAGALTPLLDFLRHDRPAHILDEEEALFPLLRRRAQPEEDVAKVLGRLSAEHAAEAPRAEAVQAHLEACLARRAAPGWDAGARAALQDFAGRELRHLALENAVVLPLARLRLSPRDLRGLSRRLAARRSRPESRSA